MTDHAAVDAAARADWERVPDRCPWDELAPAMREHMRKKVRHIVAAATPLITAEAIARLGLTPTTPTED